MNWIDIRVRKPEEKDSFKGKVWALFDDGSSGCKDWGWVASGDSIAIAWLDPKTLPKFTPIPDPPEGYRFKQEGDVFTKDALVWLDSEGRWAKTVCESNYATCGIYAVPIDPPKPQYRPFANAAEFEPYENRFWRYKDDIPTVRRSPQFYSDDGHCSDGWDYCFSRKEFSDGTPFGLPV